VSGPRLNKLYAGAAFFAIYVFWGSTYLGITLAIKTIPPFFMSAARFLVAGGLLYVGCRICKVPRPSLKDLVRCAVLGFLLVFAGNAGSTWALQHIPSGPAALLVGTEPLWLVLLAWAMGYEAKPRKRVWIGLLIGLAGMAVLVGGASPGQTGPVQCFSMGVVVLAAIVWALGSVISVGMKSTCSPFMAAAVMMLSGGGAFGVAGAIVGEWHRFDLSRVSTSSVLALLYLSVFGSMIALSAYTWLLRRYPSRRVATYAFVNPLVAVGLGWMLAGERITVQTGVACVAIMVSVGILISRPRITQP
jgi:drug/metabolite transporter (DMT)-like permease